MKYSNKKIILESLNSIENEFTIDLALYRLQGEKGESFAYAPRPSLWLSRLKHKKKYVSFLFKLLRLLWGYIGFFFYTIYILIKNYLIWRGLDKVNNVKMTYDELALAFSQRAYDVIPKALSREPRFWLTFPWNNQKKNVPNRISFLFFLERKDFFKAFLLACCAHKIMLDSKIFKKHILQSYILPQWILVKLALQRINIKKIIIAEHFDRWAVMSDCLVFDERSELSLVQHGTLVNLGREEEFLYKIPHKLKNVSALYVFNEFSEKMFRLNVLEEKSCPEIYYYTSHLELVEVNSSQFKILFVGHPMCEAVQIKIFEKIIQYNEIQFFYKPHPLSYPSKDIYERDWFIINDKNFYPLVDLVISYPSTLAEEYKYSGVSVVTHGVGEGDEFEFNTVLSSIVSKINLNKNNMIDK